MALLLLLLCGGESSAKIGPTFSKINWNTQTDTQTAEKIQNVILWLPYAFSKKQLFQYSKHALQLYLFV